MPSHYTGEHWHRTREFGPEPPSREASVTSQKSASTGDIDMSRLAGVDYPHLGDMTALRLAAWERWKRKTAEKEAVAATPPDPEAAAEPLRAPSAVGCLHELSHEERAELFRRTTYVASAVMQATMNQEAPPSIDPEREIA